MLRDRVWLIPLADNRVGGRQNRVIYNLQMSYVQQKLSIV